MPIAFAPEKEDSLGFDNVLEKHLQAAPSTTLAQFAAPPAPYTTKLTFDPTKAKYYDLFAADIEKVNKESGNSMAKHKYRQTSFRFTDEEQALFKQNGFVVFEKLSGARYEVVFVRRQ